MKKGAPSIIVLSKNKSFPPNKLKNHCRFCSLLDSDASSILFRLHVVSTENRTVPDQKGRHRCKQLSGFQAQASTTLCSMSHNRKQCYASLGTDVTFWFDRRIKPFSNEPSYCISYSSINCARTHTHTHARERISNRN